MTATATDRDRVEDVRARLDEPGIHGPECAAIAEAVRAVLDLHRTTYEAGGRTWTSRVTVMQEDMAGVEGHVCVISGNALDQVCVPGEEHAVESCCECRVVTEDGEPAELLWPCPTVRAAVKPLSAYWGLS